MCPRNQGLLTFSLASSCWVSLPASRRNRRRAQSRRGCCDRSSLWADGPRSWRIPPDLKATDPAHKTPAVGRRRSGQPRACASGSSRRPVRSGSGRWSSAARNPAVASQEPANAAGAASRRRRPGRRAIRPLVGGRGRAAGSFRSRMPAKRTVGQVAAGASGCEPCFADIRRGADSGRHHGRSPRDPVGRLPGDGRRAVHQSVTAAPRGEPRPRTRRSTARTTRTPACCPVPGCWPRGTKPRACCRKGSA